MSENETVTQLLSYIENTPYLKPSSKRKRRDTENITPLVLPIETVESVSPILSVYTQQITLSEFNTSSNNSFLENWFGSNKQNSAFQQSSYNFNYNIMSRYNQNYYKDPYGYGYIQQPTYNYAEYYQLSQFEQQSIYQQS